MLLRIVLDMGQLFTGSKRRQLLFLLRLALIVVDDLITREHIHRVAGREAIIACDDLCVGHVEFCRSHLAGDEARPDELIELILVEGQRRLDLLRGQRRHGRADCLVGVLGVAFLFIDAGLFRQILFPVLAGDIFPCSLHSLVGDAQRVGTHVGNQTHRAQLWQVDTFVQLLRGLHGTLCLES